MEEIWKDIEGYKGLYQVSNFGRVKSLNYKGSGKEGIMKPQKNQFEYLFVVLYKDGKRKNFKLHRLVASAFVKNDNPTDKTEINHLDENKENNHVSNLCWCTRKENCNYGTHNEKLSKAKYKPIIQLDLQNNFIREWDSGKSASKELNIHKANITACCKGRYKTCGGYIWKYK